MEEDEASPDDFTDNYGSITGITFIMKEVASILEKTTDLIDNIKDSSIYVEYHSALHELNTFPKLKALTDDYREKKHQIYQSKAPISLKVLDELEERREKLAEYPQIDRFLKAELVMGRTLQEILNRITESMGLYEDIQMQ